MINLLQSVQGTSSDPVTALTPIAWYRFQQGIGTSTVATTTFVSSWQDKSGNNNHLAQATATKLPSLQSDSSVLFDGSNDCMQAVYGLNNPFTRYILGKQISWNNARLWASGVSSDTALQQATTSPQVRINDAIGIAFVSPPLDTYVVLMGMFNGTTSLIRLNLTASSVGTLTGNNAGGLTLSGTSSQLGGFSNIQVKEVIDFAGAHTTPQQNSVIVYLGTVGGINL